MVARARQARQGCGVAAATYFLKLPAGGLERHRFLFPNVQHERRPQGREGAFGMSARRGSLVVFKRYWMNRSVDPFGELIKVRANRSEALLGIRRGGNSVLSMQIAAYD